MQTQFESDYFIIYLQYLHVIFPDDAIYILISTYPYFSQHDAAILYLTAWIVL